MNNEVTEVQNLKDPMHIANRTNAIKAYTNQLFGKMVSERAVTLDDSEIKRTLGATVLPEYCIAAITHLRDHDGLTIDKVYGSWKDMATAFSSAAVEAREYNKSGGGNVPGFIDQSALVTEYEEKNATVADNNWQEFVSRVVQNNQCVENSSHADFSM